MLHTIERRMLIGFSMVALLLFFMPWSSSVDLLLRLIILASLAFVFIGVRTTYRANHATHQEILNTQLQLTAILEAQATTDGLTGLKNHRAFQEKLAAEFERNRREGLPFSVLLLDVDRFKAYNDAFGHPEGDRVLQAVANILQETARETDFTARYGGEEFVILLPNTDAQGALEAAERFRTAIESQPWKLQPLTASFGASTLQAGTATAQELVEAADRALYASKSRGRNRVTHADDMFAPAEKEIRDFELVKAEMERIAAALQHAAVNAHHDATSASLLHHAYDATIASWTRLLDMKDKETEGHSERVTALTLRLARYIGIDDQEIMYMQWGAMLHDIGKMGIPDSILLKPGPLTEEEWVVMRRHTVLANEMLSPIGFLNPALDIPCCHHEKWDGTGYPRGLRGEEIPLAARLFAVVDVWDALLSDRPYRKRWSEQEAVAYLRDNAERHFDPRAVEAFLQMLGEEPGSRSPIAARPRTGETAARLKSTP